MSIFAVVTVAGSRQPTRNIQSNIDSLFKRTRHRVTYMFLFRGDLLRKAEVWAPLMKRVLLRRMCGCGPAPCKSYSYDGCTIDSLACLPALQQWLNEKWRAPLFLHGAAVRWNQFVCGRQRLFEIKWLFCFYNQIVMGNPNFTLG